MTKDQWNIIFENIKWRCHLGGLSLKISTDIANESVEKAKKALEIHKQDLLSEQDFLNEELIK